MLYVLTEYGEGKTLMCNFNSSLLSGSLEVIRATLQGKH